MSKLRRACFQFIQEFPATSIILLIVAVMKTGAYLLNLELTEISRIEASYRNMFLLIVSIFLSNEFFFTILLILGLIFLGTVLEKVYGSYKFMLLFVLPGIIGGFILLFFTNHPVIYGALISLSGLVGSCFCLLFKQNRIVQSGKRIRYWFALGIVVSMAVITEFSSIGLLLGLGIGILFSIIFKPQTFREMVKTPLRQSVYRSLVIVFLSFLIVSVPSLFEAEMIQKMDLHKIGYYNDGFPPAQLEFYDKYHKIKDHNSCEGAEDACQSK